MNSQNSQLFVCYRFMRGVCYYYNRLTSEVILWQTPKIYNKVWSKTDYDVSL